MAAPEFLKDTLQHIPQKPGVYQYFDENETLIYVGKAKRLKNRVSSYFNKDKHESGKTKLLVKKIRKIKFILVDSEYEALLLENTLIKENKPKFNIQWRDDKTYPYIVVKNERFPRIFSTRNVIKDGSKYFGPYASVKTMHALLNLIKHLYRFRTCKYNLSEENIAAKKFRLCLEYHIGNCKGPCEALQTEADYMQSISHIKRILKGHVSEVIKDLKSEMQTSAEALDFEEADGLKKKISLLENFKARSTVVNPDIDNVDVFAIVNDDKYAYVNYLKIVQGAIVQSHTLELKKGLEESLDELLIVAAFELRKRFNSQSKEMYFPFSPKLQIPEVNVFVPQRGDKKKLIALSEKNARQFMIDRHRMQEKLDPDRRADRILSTLQKDLNMDSLPKHIECFDNSNLQGSFPVSACVVFKNAKPSKKEYRHFNIKTVVGPNDFASMEEVVQRRYRRLLEEGEPLPQLIIIDGGKGQLSASVKSLERLGILDQIMIIGIAKRLEEIFIPNESVPLYIDKRSESLKLIQNLRNEAHRFGITHHRSKRQKANLSSQLLDIDGIGKNTAESLLRQFKSLKRVKEASKEDLAAIVGQKRAKAILDFYTVEKDKT